MIERLKRENPYRTGTTLLRELTLASSTKKPPLSASTLFVLVAGSLNRQLGFGGVTASVALSALGSSLLFFRGVREPT